MRKIAIPVLEHKLSPHLGLCKHFIFYYVENGEIDKQELLQAPAKQTDLIPYWLIEKNVTDVIATGIGLKPIELFNQHKINAFVGVKKKDPGILIREFLNGTLETSGDLCDH